MKKGIGLGLVTRLNQDIILDRFERTQEGFSTITERVRESLSGIREIRASEAFDTFLFSAKMIPQTT